MNASTSKKRQFHDPDFKRRAIDLAITSSKPIGLTAKELDLKEATLYQWVREHKKQFAKNNPNEGPSVYEELADLRKKYARVQEERDILKKATQYFAKESR